MGSPQPRQALSARQDLASDGYCLLTARKSEQMLGSMPTRRGGQDRHQGIVILLLPLVVGGRR